MVSQEFLDILNKYRRWFFRFNVVALCVGELEQLY